METREGRVRITRSEMLMIRRMDHRELEERLSLIYKKGFEEGHKDGFQKQASRGKDILEAARRNWQQDLEAALEETKGIGQARKELFLENLKQKRERSDGYVPGKSIPAGQETS